MSQRGEGDAPWWSRSPEGVVLRIRAVPGARTPGVAGPIGDRLKVRVAEPPEDGRANEGIRTLLAERFDVDRRSVEILVGHASRDKTVLFRGRSAL